MALTPTIPSAATVELSADYTVTIPPEVRAALGLRPGQQLQAIIFAGRLELVPLLTPQEARGSLPNLDTNVERDPDRL